VSPGTHRVLAIGLSPTELSHFRGALENLQTSLDVASEWGDGLARVGASTYTAVVARFPAPGGSLQDLVRVMRSPGAPCMSAGAVVLAAPESMREASELVGRGVNKVISVLESPDLLACLLMRLESVGAPDGERVQIDLRLDCSVGGMLRRWRTANISMRGVLVETAEDVRPGNALRFRLYLPPSVRPVEGELKVTRLTVHGHETAQGFGARFVSLAHDGRLRLAAFIEEYRSRSRS
jgi:hypothetical protein